MHENKHIGSLTKINLDWLRKRLATDKKGMRSASYVLYSNEAYITKEIIDILRTCGCSVFTHIDKGDFPYPELKVSAEKPKFFYRFKGVEEVEACLSILKGFLDDDEAKAINIFRGWISELVKEHIAEKKVA